ncbi:MAG: type II toxin-antitoxin system VapC family toxin [Deferribacteres bacterium]|nr:type II toxin-antitoxin system VapC family toxin [Deferribacteres bacterium]
MKIYLDTSVINIYLFGRYSETEIRKFSHVSALFNLINSNKIHALISLYTLQEVFIFCKKIFGPPAGNISRLAFLELLENKISLAGLLTREERLLHRIRFNLDDLSDQPHAICAYLNKCDAIVTYDTHFQKIKDEILIYTPEEVVSIQQHQ